MAAAVNLWDLIILLVIGLSCVLGLWRGLIREVLALATWIVVALALYGYSAMLADRLEDFLGSPLWSWVLVLGLLILVPILSGALLTWMLTQMTEFVGLSLVNRALGGVFGLARGALIVCVALFGGQMLFSSTELWRESALIPHFMELIEILPSLNFQSPPAIVI